MGYDEANQLENALPDRIGLSPNLTLGLIAAFLAVQILWFGYWEAGTVLARLGLPHWPLPVADEQGFVSNMDGTFSALTRIMLAAQIVTLVFVLRRNALALWTLLIAAISHFVSWVWITGAGWFDGGPGFYIVIGEVLSLFALYRLRVTGEIR